MQDQLELPDGLFVIAHSLERASDLVVRVEHEEVVELNLAAILRKAPRTAGVSEIRFGQGGEVEVGV